MIWKTKQDKKPTMVFRSFKQSIYQSIDLSLSLSLSLSSLSLSIYIYISLSSLSLSLSFLSIFLSVSLYPSLSPALPLSLSLSISLFHFIYPCVSLFPPKIDGLLAANWLTPYFCSVSGDLWWKSCAPLFVHKTVGQCLPFCLFILQHSLESWKQLWKWPKTGTRMACRCFYREPFP